MNSNEKSNSVNKDSESVVDHIKDNNINLEDENNKKSVEDDKYVFGWGQYSEITNGRFAMIGFVAIILIEMISKKSFIDWAGIIN
tara:strand:- start:323 stop:577 length:255 start_codon:yes stop_codon:yes gene_type:complete